MQYMRINTYQTYKITLCIILSIIIVNPCFAGDAEDAIAAISSASNSKNITNGNEANISKNAAELKPKDSGCADAQLAQIEANYKAQIDAATMQQHHDAIGADLSRRKNDNKSQLTKDIQSLTDGQSNQKKIKIAKNDSLLVAAKSLDTASIDSAKGMVSIPTVTQSTTKAVDKIVTYENVVYFQS
jgi:hypothetical protein